MRALALLLIIANLGYLGWALLIDTVPAPSPQVADNGSSDVPRLVLATERVRPASSNKRLKVAAAKPPASVLAESAQDDAHKCISIGPFQDLPAVAQASAVLESAGFESRQRLEQGELWVGHWVSISGFATHEQAQSAIERLKERGVSDAYILPGGDPSNVISLGVFKENERAQRRLNEAKALGLNAAIADRTRAGSVYWVDVDLKGMKQMPDISTLASQPGKIVRLETRSCSGG